MPEPLAQAGPQALEAENKRLAAELKKLQRAHNSLLALVERQKVTAVAGARLSAVITAEKSKQEKYLNLLLENSPDVILLLDADGRFIYCTNALLGLTGIANFGLINGRAFTEVFSGGEAWVGKICDIISATMAGGATIRQDEEIDFGHGGQPRDYSITATPMLDEGGAAEGVLLLIHDSTDLIRAKEQAEQASRAKSDFLATVSHEIRTPLNAIIGISDIVKKTQLTSEQSNHINNIANSSQVLLNLINDILDFSKIEAGKLDLVEEYFRLPEYLEQMRAMFRVMFAAKDIDFICDFGELPQVVYGDERRVGQVVTNLLNNALKYTNYGSVKWRAFIEGEDVLCMEVADTGIGIEGGNIPRMFEAFEQLDTGKNKRVTGTGLGLAITRRLCEIMHGSIEVESVYGKGSVFSVRLRLPRGTEADLPAAVEEDLAFSAPEARVLLVDDIEINLMVATAMLAEYGVVPDTAQSGQEALELVRKNNYDMIFMDHMMPDMDGIETTLAIRAIGGACGSVPIIALTANAVSGAMEMFFANGFNGFLPKPVSSRALAECLLKWLPQRLVNRG